MESTKQLIPASLPQINHYKTPTTKLFSPQCFHVMLWYPILTCYYAHVIIYIHMVHPETHFN